MNKEKLKERMLGMGYTSLEDIDSKELIVYYEAYHEVVDTRSGTGKRSRRSANICIEFGVKSKSSVGYRNHCSGCVVWDFESQICAGVPTPYLRTELYGVGVRLDIFDVFPEVLEEFKKLPSVYIDIKGFISVMDVLGFKNTSDKELEPIYLDHSEEKMEEYIKQLKDGSKGA